jgi:Family of unknown function (DUF5906)
VRASRADRILETMIAGIQTEADFSREEAEAEARVRLNGHAKPTGRRRAPPDGWEEKLRAGIDELNARYFVSTISGKAVIASVERDEALNRDRLVVSRAGDVSLLYRHRHYLTAITDQNREIWKGLGDAWLEHHDRRTYDRIALIPDGKTPPGVYNLWRGFGVEPKQGDWPRLREHLLSVACAGDTSHFDWLVRWFAYGVQHPGRQAEVAVVLRGEKGAGKGSVAQILLSIFRNHGAHITQPRHLTGNFNAHLIDCLALFVDEAFWAGDRAGEGTLKALVTERTMMVEQKGIDSFAMPNRLKIIMASNNDWVVPTSADERRYFVLDVPSTKSGDSAYFSVLHAALEGEELPAFLHYLLALDLGDFDHRNPPHTAALDRQKLASADSLTKFWFDCLTNGEIVGAPSDACSFPDEDDSWPSDIVAQVLHGAYLDHAHARGDRHPLSDARMAMKLAELMPDGELVRRRNRRPYGETGRPPRYAIQDLAHCRQAFLAAMNIGKHDWPTFEEGEK